MTTATANLATPSPRRRTHPLFAAGLLAVTVAATGVAGGAAWRHHADARDTELARWQRMASTAGDADALARLTGAAQAGETAARAALGETLLARPGDHAEAGRWLRLAADSGHVRAQFVLGKAALLGQLAGGKPDLPRAWTYLEAAARAGNAGAAYYMGLLCRGGHGRPADPAAAVRWLTAAADGGVAQAMFLLANAYRDGEGVGRDDARAVAWYEAAAEREHPASIQALAMAHRNGELGLPPDEDAYRQHMAEAAHALRHPALTP